MIKGFWSFLAVATVSAIATVAVARVSFTNEGLVFRKACSALDRIRSGVPYAQCRLDLFANSTRAPVDFMAFGDSITERQDWAQNFPSVSIANRGIGGSEVRDVVKAINIVKPAAETTVILLIGVNDLLVKRRKAREIAPEYERMIENLGSDRIIGSSDHRIIVQSVILCNSAEPLCSPELRAEITELNKQIETLSRSRNLLFVDLNKGLAPSGTLDRAFSDDGVHLNQAGNRAWAKTLEPVLAGYRPRKAS